MTYEQRKLISADTGCCVYPGCDALVGDTQLCDHHRDQAKARAAKTYAAQRARRRAKRQCMRCGGKRHKASRWCLRCLIKLGKVKRSDPNKDQNNGRDRIAARTSLVTEGDGRTRKRFRGKHRGRASGAEMDAEDIRAVKSAVQRLEDGLAIARAPETAQLPRIQRDEAIRAALSHADLARRFLDEMLERHRYDRNASE